MQPLQNLGISGLSFFVFLLNSFSKGIADLRQPLSSNMYQSLQRSQAYD